MPATFKFAPALVLLAFATLPAAAQDAAITAPATVAAPEREPGTIDIQGTGEVTAAPDMAYVSSGVVTEAETARDALTANTAAMSELISVLKSAGIEDRDIQTSGFSVQPQYVYPHKNDENGFPQPPHIASYRVSNSVTVRVRDLDNLGAVLDQAVTVGSNSINGVSFGVEDSSALLDEARKKAMANAISKAGLYAGAAGVGLDRIVSISEHTMSAPQPYAKAMRADMAMAESAPVPMEAGELTFIINVQVRWELAD